MVKKTEKINFLIKEIIKKMESWIDVADEYDRKSSKIVSEFKELFIKLDDKKKAKVINHYRGKYFITFFC